MTPYDIGAKLAHLKTKLQPHQQRVVSRILDPDTHGSNSCTRTWFW